jgi:hypothetical protein
MSENSRLRKFDPEAFYGKKQKHEFEALSENIIGAAIKVHKELGPGFLENIYEGALKIELSKNQIIAELKATSELTDVHFAQLRSYLKATALKVGLLLNFAKPTLVIKRIVN